MRFTSTKSFVNLKKIIASIAILVLSINVIGCGMEETQDSVVQKTNEIVHHFLDDAYSYILENATADCIGHYPVDENFLFWFQNKYGEGALNKVASMDLTDANTWYNACGNSIHVLWLEYCNDMGFYVSDSDRIEYIKAQSDDEIVLDFTGDVNLAEGMATTLYMDKTKNGLEDCFSDDILEEMRNADVFMVNNEFAYTTRGEALQGKSYTFRANPDRVSQLKYIGVDIVGLANNHVWDFGEIGVLDTLDTLKGADIPYVGAGENIQEACKPYYYIANGKKIAIVNATQIERSYTYTKQATEDMAGVLKTLDPTLFCAVIENAKKNADYCIVFVHWGTEGNAKRGNDQVALSNRFARAGADVIIGGHTHCLQGVEYVLDVPVFSSLGNFFFSLSAEMPTDYKTGIAQVVINSDNSVETRLIPCEFSKGVVSLVPDNQKESYYSYIQNISSSSVIDENGYFTPR